MASWQLPNMYGKESKRVLLGQYKATFFRVACSTISPKRANQRNDIITQKQFLTFKKLDI